MRTRPATMPNRWSRSTSMTSVGPKSGRRRFRSWAGSAFGEFDAFAGVSLDDGTSWKRTNLSRSADLSSFTLANGHPYPGDVHNVRSPGRRRPDPGGLGQQVLRRWRPALHAGPDDDDAATSRTWKQLRQGCGLPVRPVWRGRHPGFGGLYAAGLSRSGRNPLLLCLDGAWQAAGRG